MTCPLVQQHVAIEDTIWTIVDSVREMLGMPANDGEQDSLASHTSRTGMTLDQWLHQHHLMALLEFVLSILEQDMAVWRSRFVTMMLGS